MFLSGYLGLSLPRPASPPEDAWLICITPALHTRVIEEPSHRILEYRFMLFVAVLIVYRELVNGILRSRVKHGTGVTTGWVLFWVTVLILVTYVDIDPC
jgi:hypothetical protein